MRCTSRIEVDSLWRLGPVGHHGCGGPPRDIRVGRIVAQHAVFCLVAQPAVSARATRGTGCTSRSRPLRAAAATGEPSTEKAHDFIRARRIARSCSLVVPASKISVRRASTPIAISADRIGRNRMLERDTCTRRRYAQVDAVSALSVT